MNSSNFNLLFFIFLLMCVETLSVLQHCVATLQKQSGNSSVCFVRCVVVHAECQKTHKQRSSVV